MSAMPSLSAEIPVWSYVYVLNLLEYHGVKRSKVFIHKGIVWIEYDNFYNAALEKAIEYVKPAGVVILVDKLAWYKCWFKKHQLAIK